MIRSALSHVVEFLAIIAILCVLLWLLGVPVECWGLPDMAACAGLG